MGHKVTVLVLPATVPVLAPELLLLPEPPLHPIIVSAAIAPVIQACVPKFRVMFCP